ncbi:MAG: division/cell wall cluster transcriptional repressor MraZ [Oscillospiraceae bacterium]
MLFGEYQHSVDAKGRVNFPSRLREELGEKFMVCKGLGDRCLFVYSMEEFEKLKNKLEELPMAKSKQLKRFIFAGATDAEPDKQGRIIIPAVLRNYAEIKKDVVIIGASTRAEIWDKELWEQCNDSITAEMIENVMEELNF